MNALRWEAYGQDYALQVETENLSKIEAEGITVIELDDTVYAQMKEASSEVESMVRSAVGDELVDAYLAAIAAASK